MSIAKVLFRRKTVFLLAAAILLAALPPLKLLRAGTPPESGAPEAGPGDTAAESALELNARDEDAPQTADSVKDLAALLAEAGAGSEEMELALESLNEVDVDAEEKALPEAAGAAAAEKEPAGKNSAGPDADRLEKGAEKDDKEISGLEKESESAAEPGEDDKGDTIEWEDLGMDH